MGKKLWNAHGVRGMPTGNELSPLSTKSTLATLTSLCVREVLHNAHSLTSARKADTSGTHIASHFFVYQADPDPIHVESLLSV